MNRVARVVLIAALVAIAGMWIYAFSGAARDDHPDRLDDRDFAESARGICADAQARIARLPRADEADSPAERAGVVDEANEALRSMVSDLRALPAPAGDDARVVEEWLGDWDTHIDDRQAWADLLRAGDDRGFAETEKAGGPVSELMDNFANANELPECRTPGDV